jgi:ABC-type polysaccharide/polyol phosphate export permease/Flp pilus assembly protein TadD
LSIDHNLPQLAIDTAEFTRALDSGALDACLDYLRLDDAVGPESAWLNCRLGERLFYNGRSSEALECGRRAFAAAANDNEIIHFCAWLFSNCGCHGEAASAYRRLIADRPDWVEGYRHASGSLAAIGATEQAIAFACEASDLAPHNPDFALHAGCLLLDAGRDGDAARYLARTVAIEPADPRALRALSVALAHDRPGDALGLALMAVAAAPQDSAVAIHAAELLLRNGRADEAAVMLDNAVRSDPGNPTLWRLLSTAESQRGEMAASLAAIDRALELAPDNPEYHLHRSHLHYRLGDVAVASEAVARAITLDPGGQEAKRAQITLLLAEDRLTEAAAAGGALLQAFPEDEASAETVLQVLNRRLDTIDGDYSVIGDQTGRLVRQPRPVPGFAERLRTQLRIIHALMIRETRTRFGDSRLGYGWALLEPILHIVLLSSVFSLLMHGKPPIGGHFFIFYFTGLIPYLVFVHTSTSMTHAVTGNAALLQLPPVTAFDVIVARGVLEFVTDVVIAVILLTGFAALGIPALPDDLWNVAAALIMTALLGCGVGFANAVVQTLFRSWDKLWGNATRLLYFFSGIFYVPGMMPDWARDVLSWNPMLQAIDWFRVGFFATYRPHWLDQRYLVVTAILALLAGLAAERALRRRLSEPL